MNHEGAKNTKEEERRKKIGNLNTGKGVITD
jgi:hypothetical protein